MEYTNLKIFWADPNVAEEFYLLPSEAWEGRDPADYYNYRMDFSYELQLCHCLAIEADNFLPKVLMDKLDDEREVTHDATE